VSSRALRLARDGVTLRMDFASEFSPLGERARGIVVAERRRS
jgi:hypothetical protein